jgi:hypothetical protein
VASAGKEGGGGVASRVRAGFFIGDGAGMGKGRGLAGLIYENVLRGRRKHVWVSASNDLKFDAERDLRDVGCDLKGIEEEEEKRV